jgi:hypothetical protein
MRAIAAEEVLREPKTLFLVGSYSIGKENAIEAVAKGAGSQALVNFNRARTLKLSGRWDPTVYTEADSRGVMVRVAAMGASDHAEALRLLEGEGGRYDAVVAFRPTGWTYSKGQDAAGYKPWVENDGRTRLYSVPYSEHSSFPQLVQFVKTVAPAAIVPTVNLRESDKLVNYFVDSMDLSNDRGRIDAYLRKPGSAAGAGAGAAAAPKPAAAAEAGGAWSCAACTLINENAHGLACAVCQTPRTRPDGAAAAEGGHEDGAGAAKKGQAKASAARSVDMQRPLAGLVVAVPDGRPHRLFKSQQKVVSKLTQLGAQTLTRITPRCSHVLVPEGTKRSMLTKCPAAVAVVTESWLVRFVRASEQGLPPPADLIAAAHTHARATNQALSDQRPAKRPKPSAAEAGGAAGDGGAIGRRVLVPTKEKMGRLARALSERWAK